MSSRGFALAAALGAFVAAGALGGTPSDENVFVEVSSGTWGVENVVCLGEDNLDFHVTTTNVPVNFKARVHVESKAGELESSSDFDLGVGKTSEWRLRIGGDVERAPCGDITLYKADVEIDGVDEGDEVAEGAFIGAVDLSNIEELLKWSPSYRVPVSIKCWPASPRLNDRIAIQLAGVSDILIVEKDGRFSLAQREYEWGEVNDMKFWIVGMTPSSRRRDRMISVRNTVNGCHDEAFYTVVKLESIEVGCSKMPTNLGRLLKNPETFEPECDFFGRPDLNPPYWWEPGTYTNPASKVFLLFYKYVSDAERKYTGCDIQLKAKVLPADIEKADLRVEWKLRDGPDSGAFSDTNKLETLYQHPTEGGLYKFKCTLDVGNYSTWGDGWALLPRAGGEISDWLAAEVPIMIDRATNWIDEIKSVAIANGHNIKDLTKKAWIGIAAFRFDYQGVVGTPTKRYSFVDDDREPGHDADETKPGMGGLKGNGDWDEPSFATLSGVVISRSKITNLMYAVWGRQLGYTKRELLRGARLNAMLRGEKESASSQNSISLGADLYDAYNATGSVSGKITRAAALRMQTSDVDGINDVNLWADHAPVIYGFEFPAMETDYTTWLKLHKKARSVNQ